MKHTDTERLDWFTRNAQEIALETWDATNINSLRDEIDSLMDREAVKPAPITIACGCARATMTAK